MSRYDIATDTMSNPMVCGGVQEIISTPSGHVLMRKETLAECDRAYCIYAFDPMTGELERLEGFESGAETNAPLVMIDSARLLICNENDSLTLVTFTLSPEYFPLPTCCDRDL